MTSSSLIWPLVYRTVTSPTKSPSAFQEPRRTSVSASLCCKHSLWLLLIGSAGSFAGRQDPVYDEWTSPALDGLTLALTCSEGILGEDMRQGRTQLLASACNPGSWYKKPKGSASYGDIRCGLEETATVCHLDRQCV